MQGHREVEYMWPPRTNREVFLPIAPFTHIYGFMEGVLVPMSARGETVIPERFQPEHIVELLARVPRDFLRRRAAGHLCRSEVTAESTSKERHEVRQRGRSI